jgi:hypothetical protein
MIGGYRANKSTPPRAYALPPKSAQKLLFSRSEAGDGAPESP